MEFAVRVHVPLRINCNNCSNSLTFYLVPSLCQNLVHDPGTLWVRWTLSYHFITFTKLKGKMLVAHTGQAVRRKEVKSNWHWLNSGRQSNKAAEIWPLSLLENKTVPYPQAGFQVIALSLNDTRKGGKKTLYWQLKNKTDKWSISHRIIFSLEGIWCENVFMSQLQEVCRLRFVRHSSTLSKDGWITSWRRREWGGDRLIGVRSTDRQEEVKRDRQTDEGRNQRRRWKTWREWIKLE